MVCFFSFSQTSCRKLDHISAHAFLMYQDYPHEPLFPFPTYVVYATIEIDLYIIDSLHLCFAFVCGNLLYLILIICLIIKQDFGGCGLD